MRINAGKYRGRKLNITNLETTRETSDKVRQAIFNTARQFFDGGVALDLFAGSGSMGLEAISRGIDKVYFNDLNQIALNTVRDNLNLIKEKGNHVLTNMDYLTFLNRHKNIKFDLIFLDPPYKMENVNEILDFIDINQMLAKNGIVIFEMHRDTVYNTKAMNSIVFYKEKNYGIKKIAIFKGGIVNV